MAKIETEGYYDIIMGKPAWTEADRKGVKHAVLEIPCTAENGDTAVHHMEFSSFMVKRDGGMVPLAKTNADLCVRLGMSDPFNPAKVAELAGKPASIQVVLEKWPDKQGVEHQAYRAKYINAPKQTISDDRAAALIAAAIGNAVQVEATMSQPAPSAVGSTLPDEQFPF